MSPPRILSLLPSATEIVGALGLADHLVGVTHECDACPDAPGMARLIAAGVERVTISHIDPHRMTQGAIDTAVKESLASGLSLYALDEEAVRRARPGVVLTQALCAVCAPATEEVAEVCERLGPALADEEGREPAIVNLEPTTLGEVAATFEEVARACGVAARGAALREEFEAKLARLADATRTDAPPRVLLLEWLDPPFDGGHWVPEQIEAAGGVPVLNAPGGKSSGRSWDEVEATDPDVVVVACCGFDLARNVADARALLDPENSSDAARRFRELPAVRAGRVFALDGNRYFARPAPSLAEGAAILARCTFDEDVAATRRIEDLGFLPEEGVAWARLDRAPATPPPAPEPAAVASPWDVHRAACAEGLASYLDPITGYRVFTAVALEARGKCCGCGCRHCPYGHENVEDKAARIQQPAFLHRHEGARTEDRHVLFWSGGKDSFLAYRALARELDDPAASLLLLTTFDADSRVLAHQGIPIATIVRQAEVLGLDLVGIPLHPGTDYLERVHVGLDRVCDGGARVASLAFGDLHLDPIREWRDRELGPWGIPLRYPLWGVPYGDLHDELEASGVPCELTTSPGKDGAPPPEDLAPGTPFDRALAARFAGLGWDAFGEVGEFHTLARVWERT